MAAELDSRSKGTVLLLACFFPPENTSGSARPFRFYKYLPKFNYDVRVLTASQQNSDGPSDVVCVPEKIRKGPKRILRDIAQRILRNLIADESLTWSFRAWDAAKEIAAREKICAVFSTSSPAISHVVGALLKSRYGIPWVADFRDPLVGNPFRKKGGLTGLVDRVMQKWIFRRADALIATTDATVDLWRRENPEYAAKMHVIWNGFDPEDGLRANPVPPREYKLIVHAGVLYGPRHPGVLLSSLQRLSERGLLSSQKLQLHLVGLLVGQWCREPQQADALVRQGLLRCDGHMVPKEEAEAAIADADSLLLLDLHVEGGAIQVPAKLFDYVRIGRPILAITTRNSPVDRLLARSGVPYCSLYPEDSADEVDAKVLHFVTLPSEPVVADEWFWKEFDAVAQTRQLASLIGSLSSDTVNRAGISESRSPARRERLCGEERSLQDSQIAM
jgi:glycosyltransferase involved in cell wall biosynthesis